MLSGQEIISLLESAKLTIMRVPDGSLDCFPHDRMTALQHSVVRRHSESIVRALETLLASFRCPWCRSLCWLAPERPAARYWTCGVCVAWGEVLGETRLTRNWTFCPTIQ
jgi:hypothetical protein